MRDSKYGGKVLPSVSSNWSFFIEQLHAADRYAGRKPMVAHSLSAAAFGMVIHARYRSESAPEMIRAETIAIDIIVSAMRAFHCSYHDAAEAVSNHPDSVREVASRIDAVMKADNDTRAARAEDVWQEAIGQAGAVMMSIGDFRTQG
jgi:hypothetical protein